MRPAPLFELAGVRYAAGGRTLLHGIDLLLPAGGVCGLIGRSGSGKTTLLRLLARQVAPSGGGIRFRGRSLDRWRSRELARRLAYMPQTPPSAPELRLRDLVMLGRFPWHGTTGRVTAADRAAAAAAMAGAGVASLADRPLAELSGGERQRAWIAMCVAQADAGSDGESGCLLLDEPISALDIAHQVEALRVVRRLSAARGLSVLMVLHDINLAARFCDELIALRDGHLVARGGPPDVMREGVLHGIYGARLGLLPHPGGGAPISYVP